MLRGTESGVLNTKTRVFSRNYILYGHNYICYDRKVYS